MKTQTHFIAFKQNISGINLPQKFTFPFKNEVYDLKSGLDSSVFFE